MFSSEIIQIFKFGLVGVWNTGFSMTLYYVLYRLLGSVVTDRFLGIRRETLAHGGSFLVANILSYWLNSRFTFEAGEGSAGEFTAYAAVSTVSLVLSGLIINYLAQDRYYHLTKTWFQKTISRTLPRDRYAILIEIVAIVIVMAVNYLGYKYLVFGG